MTTVTKLHPKLDTLGPWALVTGASDGIGAATARELAAHGFNLLLSARRKPRLEELAQDLQAAHGTEVKLLSADLSQVSGVTELLQWVASPEGCNGTPGVAVLAAGFGSTGELKDRPIETEVDMLRVNCEAVLRMSHALCRDMESSGSGQLVLFGSLVGFQGNAMTANYSATKAYVQTLAVAKAIVKRLGTSGTIRPGLLSKVLGYNMAMTPRPNNPQPLAWTEFAPYP